MTTERFPLMHIKQLLEAKEDVVLEWAKAIRPLTIDDSVNANEAAVLGAVLTMKLRTTTKDGQLRTFFRQVLMHEGPSDEWLVVRRARGVPQIEQPPIRIDVTGPLKARPVIYDPMTFLDDLRKLARDNQA